jgi:hypothetical protein
VSVLAMAAAEYHDGADEKPRLSASIAKLLVTASPLHAWTAHPRLNPNYARVEEDRFDIGNVVHALLLEGVERAVVGEWSEYRTDASKAWRDGVREQGLIPLKPQDAERVFEAVEGIRVKLGELARPLFVDGKPEQTIHWSEEGVDFKARLDWLRDDFTEVNDLKSTARLAHPDAFSRRICEQGGDIQAALYMRAVERATALRPDFVWCVAETSPPFEIAAVMPGEDVLAFGEARLEKAIRLWRACLATNTWPGYDRRVAVAELPQWVETQWMAQEAREEAA